MNPQRNITMSHFVSSAIVHFENSVFFFFLEGPGKMQDCDYPLEKIEGHCRCPEHLPKRVERTGTKPYFMCCEAFDDTKNQIKNCKCKSGFAYDSTKHDCCKSFNGYRLYYVVPTYNLEKL